MLRPKFLQTTEIQLKAGKVNVNITRRLFDTKMAAILDGVGGAPCHLCTCTRNQLMDIDLISREFPLTAQSILRLRYSLRSMKTIFFAQLISHG